MFVPILESRLCFPVPALLAFAAKSLIDPKTMFKVAELVHGQPLSCMHHCQGISVKQFFFPF
jgi:hypothetical protein